MLASSNFARSFRDSPYMANSLLIQIISAFLNNEKIAVDIGMPHLSCSAQSIADKMILSPMTQVATSSPPHWVKTVTSACVSCSCRCRACRQIWLLLAQSQSLQKPRVGLFLWEPRRPYDVQSDPYGRYPRPR